nr:unnamed protein product [Callosobruchus chinensis]
MSKASHSGNIHGKELLPRNLNTVQKKRSPHVDMGRNGNEPDVDVGGRRTSFLEWNAIRLSQVEGEVQHSDDGSSKWEDTGIEDVKIRDRLMCHLGAGPSFWKMTKQIRER